MKNRKPLPRYTKERIQSNHWHIKLDGKVVGTIGTGSDMTGRYRYQFFCLNIKPVKLVGFGFRTSQEAFDGYVDAYPLK